jgi:hypothetical protein
MRWSNSPQPDTFPRFGVSRAAMNCEDYDKQLHLLLGVRGPMNHTVVDGVSFLTYKLPDGRSKDLPTPQDMTPAQRSATIEELKRHLVEIAERRKRTGRR